MMGWIEQARTVETMHVLQLLGIRPKRAPNQVWPCPACGAEHRGSSDRRPPVNVLSKGGWQCQRGDCQAKGGGLDAVAYVLTGSKFKGLSRHQHEEVWRWYADHGFCDGPSAHKPDPRRARRAAVVKAKPPPAPKRASPPPAQELGSFWKACRPLDANVPSYDLRPPIQILEDLSRETGAVVHPEVSEWLFEGESGPLDVEPELFLARRHLLARFDPALVRVTPLEGPPGGWPQWWPEKWATRYRIVVPAFDIEGRGVSVHARAVPLMRDGHQVCERCGTILDGRKCPECGWKPGPKTIWPRRGSGSAEGLLMADRAGRALLQGERPEGLTGVWITEGITCWLAGLKECLRTPNRRRAVFGGTSGSFKAFRELRRRLPKDVPIYVFTDPDEAGERYAQETIDGLGDTHQIYRGAW